MCIRILPNDAFCIVTAWLALAGNGQEHQGGLAEPLVRGGARVCRVGTCLLGGGELPGEGATQLSLRGLGD